MITMATTDEIRIDLDAIESVADVKAKKNGAKDPAVPAVVVADDKAADTPELKPEDGLAKLQKQLDSEKAARAESDRRANEASAAEVAARTESQENRLHLLTTAIDSIKNSNAALKARYIEARAANDTDAEFEVQQEISKNAASLIALENGKKALENSPKPTPRVSQDPIDIFTKDMSPRSAAWIRSHPETVRDPKLNRKMIRAHEDALDEGISPDTPEYFATLERAIGVVKDVKLEDPTDDAALSAAAAPAKSRAPASAPVSRSGNGAGPRPNVVTLSAAEVEMAELTNLTPEEFARQKIRIQKERGLN